MLKIKRLEIQKLKKGVDMIRVDFGDVKIQPLIAII
jgi:hypothetical protein